MVILRLVPRRLFFFRKIDFVTTAEVCASLFQTTEQKSRCSRAPTSTGRSGSGGGSPQTRLTSRYLGNRWSRVLSKIIQSSPICLGWNSRYFECSQSENALVYWGRVWFEWSWVERGTEWGLGGRALIRWLCDHVIELWSCQIVEITWSHDVIHVWSSENFILKLRRCDCMLKMISSWWRLLLIN